MDAKKGENQHFTAAYWTNDNSAADEILKNWGAIHPAEFARVIMLELNDMDTDLKRSREVITKTFRETKNKKKFDHDMIPYETALAKKTAEIRHEWRGKKILVVGCGKSLDAKCLQELFQCTVVATDFDPIAVAWQAAHGNLIALQADFLAEEPLRPHYAFHDFDMVVDDSFTDVFTSNWTSQNTPRPVPIFEAKRGLKNLMRYLRPGTGIFVAKTVVYSLEFDGANSAAYYSFVTKTFPRAVQPREQYPGSDPDRNCCDLDAVYKLGALNPEKYITGKTGDYKMPTADTRERAHRQIIKGTNMGCSIIIWTNPLQWEKVVWDAVAPSPPAAPASQSVYSGHIVSTRQTRQTQRGSGKQQRRSVMKTTTKRSATKRSATKRSATKRSATKLSTTKRSATTRRPATKRSRTSKTATKRSKTTAK